MFFEPGKRLLVTQNSRYVEISKKYQFGSAPFCYKKCRINGQYIQNLCTKYLFKWYWNCTPEDFLCRMLLEPQWTMRNVVNNGCKTCKSVFSLHTVPYSSVYQYQKRKKDGRSLSIYHLRRSLELWLWENHRTIWKSEAATSSGKWILIYSYDLRAIRESFIFPAGGLEREFCFFHF